MTDSRYKVDEKFKWTEWLEKHGGDCGMCDPPLDPQTAIQILYEYLLPECSERSGCGYIVTISESMEQINSVIVDHILNRYSKEYKKELKEYKAKREKKEREEEKYRIYLYRRKKIHDFFQSLADLFTY